MNKQVDLYFDIRNGDVAVSYTLDGDFLGADVIKCGEWFTLDDEEEFNWYMDFCGVDIFKKKWEAINEKL